MTDREIERLFKAKLPTTPIRIEPTTVRATIDRARAEYEAKRRDE
jgi:hypothetical protein